VKDIPQFVDGIFNFRNAKMSNASAEKTASAEMKQC
jgi:hypothetical protein